MAHYGASALPAVQESMAGHVSIFTGTNCLILTVVSRITISASTTDLHKTPCERRTSKQSRVSPNQRGKLIISHRGMQRLLTVNLVQ